MRAGWVDGWTVVAERVVVYLEPIPLRPATPLLPLPAGRVDAARAVRCVAACATHTCMDAYVARSIFGEVTQPFDHPHPALLWH